MLILKIKYVTLLPKPLHFLGVKANPLQFKVLDNPPPDILGTLLFKASAVPCLQAVAVVSPNS